MDLRENAWLTVLVAGLQDLSSVAALDVHPADRGLWLTPQYDHGLEVDGRKRARLYRLQPVSAGEGFPQDVRRALRAQWDDAQTTPGETVIRVFHAPRFSPGARDLLDQAHASYMDRFGTVRIIAPGLLVNKEGTISEPDGRRSGWSRGSAAVAEALLAQFEHDVPSISALAAQAAVSPATAGKALQFFDAEGWTRNAGAARGVNAHRVLLDAAGLLGSWSRWSQRHQPESVLAGHALWQDARDFVSRALAPALPPDRWCLSGWAAADLLAPYATTVPTLTVYLDPTAWPTAQSELRAVLRPVEQGARVFIHLLDPALIRLGRGGALPTASAPRVYVDLLREGSRGEAAADHLRQVVLRV